MWRLRKIMAVALARRLLMALCKFVSGQLTS